MILKIKGKDKIYDVLIDDRDYNKIKYYKWYVGKHIRKFKSGESYYYTIQAYNSYKKSPNVVVLSRIIMNAKKEEKIDHRDHDIFNNRRYNLRRCTNEENCYNQIKSINNKSGVKGVSFRSDINKWRVRVTKSGKTYCFGNFDDKEEAKKIYNINAKKLFKQFAFLN